MCGTILFGALGLIFIALLSYFLNTDFLIAYALLPTMLLLFYCLRITKSRMEFLAKPGWEKLIEFEPELDEEQIEDFYMTNAGIFVPQTFAMYRFSPFRRGEAASEAVGIQFLGIITIGYSIWDKNWIPAIIAIILIILNTIIFKHPNFFYSDSHKDNIKRAYLNYLLKMEKEEKQSLFNLHSSRFYTESVASITYMKIAEALENMFTEKYENKND